MKTKEIKHRPVTWEKLTGIEVLDPDGWRKDNKSYYLPITEQEWNERVMWSTIGDIQVLIKRNKLQH